MAPARQCPGTEEPKVFKADHPFMFLIRHNATGRDSVHGAGGESEGVGDDDVCRRGAEYAEHTQR